VRPSAVVGAVLLAVGGTLFVLGLLQGGTSFAIVVVVPVFFTRSWELAVGVLLLTLGLFALLYAVSEPVAFAPSLPDAGGSGGGSAGLLVIGPVPIFFGSWTRLSVRARWAVTILCVVVFVALIVFVAFVV